MSENIVISIDAMGGDNAPDAIIEGVALSSRKHPKTRFMIYGDEARCKSSLEKHSKKLKNYEFINTTAVVSNDDKPGQVIRNKETSMWQAVNAVKQGKADAVVSAGNTGALMAISKLALRTLQKIHRPAICTIMPTIKGRVVVLDLGANIECGPENLVEFAIMGEKFAKIVLGVENPKVGLLNIGSEDMKGREELQKASEILKTSFSDINFHGFVEANNIAEGLTDVVVTDGFTGNIALKSIEGTAKLVLKLTKKAFMGSVWGLIMGLLSKPIFKKVKKVMDPRLYNGAMFLGLNGLSVKSHGGADAFAFSIAVNNAIMSVKGDLNERIKDEINGFNLDEMVKGAE